MSRCIVTVDGEKYDGEYTINNKSINLDVFNFSSGLDIELFEGTVGYKEMAIMDPENGLFLYSPVFCFYGVTNALPRYETYKTDFYLSTSYRENIKRVTNRCKVKSITFYHPLLAKFLYNSKLSINRNDDGTECTVTVKTFNKTIFIEKRNIDRIEFGGSYSYDMNCECQRINIETSHFIKMFLIEAIELEEVLQYINEFDVYLNAYSLMGMRSCKTYVEIEDDTQFILTHKLLDDEEYCRQIVHPVVNMSLDAFLEKMYKSVDYRESKNRNIFLPFEFKKPISLEDQYIYYYRYIDLYMGEVLRNETGKEPSNYDRISRFVDDNLDLFDAKYHSSSQDLKNELNSLRNHYVHEGYYLPNDEFPVTSKKEIIYHKKLDVAWLYRVTSGLKLGVYKIIYTKVLDVQTSENVLRRRLMR